MMHASSSHLPQMMNFHSIAEALLFIIALKPDNDEFIILAFFSNDERPPSRDSTFGSITLLNNMNSFITQTSIEPCEEVEHGILF